MRKRTKVKRKIKVGQSPGTLVYLGSKPQLQSKISIFDYDTENFEEVQISNLEDCAKYKNRDSVTWINIDGLQDIELIRNLGEKFSIHPLVLEDILNTNHRPKIDDLGDQIFIVLKMIYLPDGSDAFHHEHLSIVLGSNYVITFQESTGDVFNPVRERIRNSKGRLRKLGSDYLAYALIDTVVDAYFLALESLEDKIEVLDDDVLYKPTQKTLRKIYNLKQEVSFLKKAIWPLRDIVTNIMKAESDLIQESTYIFLRDLHDHIIQALELIDSARDTLSSQAELYMSSVSNKLNETMKVLTVLASIFIPLTFIVGIYGMNFVNMPELEWKYGYLYVWILMLALSGFMVLYLKKKKWI